MNEDNEKPTFFVSRRGRQVGVHEVDMNGIDIDTPAETSQPVKKEAKSSYTSGPSKSSVNVVRDRKPFSRRKKLIVLFIVIAILIIPVFIAELVTAQYSGGISGAKDDMNKLINSAVLPAQKKSAMTADDIRKVSGQVNGIASGMCRGGVIDNIAKLYPRAKTAHDECKETQNKYVTLTRSLYTLETQARYLEGVGSVMKPVSTPITEEFAVIGAQQEMWTKASEDLKKLNPPSEFQAVHSELVTRVSSVGSNWSKLNQANGGQDSAGFEEAEKALNTEYEAIRSTSSQIVSILSGTQSKVLNAYSATK